MTIRALPITMSLTVSIASLAWLAVPTLGVEELGAPFQAEAGGKPIDVEVGHAAPLMTDFDGDGVQDLLVGQFGDGKLRVYRNSGSNTAPKLAAFTWFQAGRSDGKVPSG
jgi:hypothetical protein